MLRGIGGVGAGDHARELGRRVPPGRDPHEHEDEVGGIDVVLERGAAQQLRVRLDLVPVVRGAVRLVGRRPSAERLPEEQADQLSSEACTELQGYLFSKPLRAAAIPELLERLGTEAGIVQSVAG